MRQQKPNHSYMISFKKAQQLIIENTPLKQTETVNNKQLLGRVTSQPVYAPIAIPPFHNSAMDGYAVNAEDLSNASSENPATLELKGLTAAGDTSQLINNTKGTAWKIMTGAPVPQGYDSVIPIESTQLKKEKVTCFCQVNQNANIRYSGEDFTQGELFISANQLINYNKMMALDALGISQLNVYQTLRVSVLSTGKELVDDINQPLKPGQIRNSNKPYLINWLKQLPTKITDLGTNHDTPNNYQSLIKEQVKQHQDIIISTGAVSMGDFDFIPNCIEQLGGKIIFHKVKIRPGKPILFARFPNGTLYFGLPGNPISCAVGLRFFINTAIRKMLGLDIEDNKTLLLDNHFNKKSGLTSILKAKAKLNHTGQLVGQILSGQESFKIKPITDSNGWIVIDEEKEVSTQGEAAKFYESDFNWG